jgi:hypothetical protein
MGKSRPKPKRYYVIHHLFRRFESKIYYGSWDDVEEQIDIPSKNPARRFHAFDTEAEAQYYAETGHVGSRSEVRAHSQALEAKNDRKLVEYPVEQIESLEVDSCSSAASTPPPAIKSEPFPTIPMPPPAVPSKQIKEKSDGWTAVTGNERAFYKYYAVAKGRKPGLYSNWDDAREQVDGFSHATHQKFKTREQAIQFMCIYGIEESKIRFFKRTFTANATYEPKSSTGFKEEFRNFANSQAWGDDRTQRSKAMVKAIREELIYHYLPEGVAHDQVDDRTGNISLETSQKLKIYQAMCKQARKEEHNTIHQCTAELKRAPYVNIIDFIDAVRTCRPVNIFHDWEEFLEFTKSGRTIPQQYAHQSEFLVPLLQKLRGPRPRESHIAPPPAHPRCDRYIPNMPRYRPEPQIKHENTPDLQRPQSRCPDVDRRMNPIKEASPHHPTTPPALASQGVLSSIGQPFTQLPPLSPVSTLNSSPSASRSCSPMRPVADPQTPFTSPDAVIRQALIKLELTTPYQKSAQIPDTEISSFIDLIEDDEEVFTQLSQQPQLHDKKRQEEQELDALEDLISDDEAISTQLSQMPSCTPSKAGVHTKNAIQVTPLQRSARRVSGNDIHTTPSAVLGKRTRAPSSSTPSKAARLHT